MFREITQTIRSLHPTPRELRWFGILLAAIIPIIGVGTDALAARLPYLVGLALLITFASLVEPRALKPIHLLLMTVAVPIGWIVSRLLLGLVFYGVLTPMALGMRLAKKDPLKLRRTNTQSYWEPLEQNRNPDTMHS